MTNQQIANRLHSLVEAGDYFTAYDELFHPNAVAQEPQLAEMGLAEVKGVPAIKAKVASMSEGIAELISRDMSTPIVSGNHIAFTNVVKAKMKDDSEFQLSEICLYEVKDGQIVSEQFFY
ncbi:MAG: nuclear transport factor 2 family protein [Bacteroidota bacterium]